MTPEPSSSKTIFESRQRQSGLLTILAFITLYGAIILFGVSSSSPPTTRDYFALFISTTGILYSIYLLYFVIPFSPRRRQLGWLTALTNGLGIGLLAVILPLQPDVAVGALTLLAGVITAMTVGRLPAYLLIALSAATVLGFRSLPAPSGWAPQIGPYLTALVLSETIIRLQEANRRHINRLEALNSFARQIGSSIETEQVVNSLHIAIQRSLKADTYYVAFVKGEFLFLSMLYDDGEYFFDLEVPLENSLAGRVATHQEPLFLTNLPKEQKLTNMTYTTVGKDKINLSWMGAPLKFGHDQVGVLAVASYRVAAFDEADFELLQNLAQQASTALDNAHHHAESVHQSHLDSLTQAYNHGYFLEILNQQADLALQNHGVLSLIMLDIDQFKQYNDLYGHLVGDQVLVAMTNAIRRNIKSIDALGRWGGEEFAIMLPNADGAQACDVAARIRDMVRGLRIHDRQGDTIPAPTISQGVAVFPLETDDVFRLVDLADQRLYIAKEHGRDQIEPPPTHWSHIRSPKSQIKQERF